MDHEERTEKIKRHKGKQISSLSSYKFQTEFELGGELTVLIFMRA